MPGFFDTGSAGGFFPDAGALPLSGGTLTGDFTMTGGVMTVRADTDTVHVFGRCVLQGASDSAQVGHYDQQAAGAPSLVQLATGETRLQANGSGSATVNLTMNATNIWQVEISNYDFIPVADNSRSIGSATKRVVNFFTSGYMMLSEMTPPGAAPTDRAHLYCDVSGAKTRLMVIFQSGAAQQIAIEP